MDHLFPYPKMGHSFLEILDDPLTRKLLGFDAVHAEKTTFMGGVSSRFKFLLNDPMKHLSFLKIGYTALEAFLQANCTGPPLDFNPEEHIFSQTYRDATPELKTELLSSLAVDGTSVYPLTQHIELFWLAHLVMSSDTLAESGFNGRRARFRVSFWHQKMLGERSEGLHDVIYSDADVLEHQLSSRIAFGGAAAEEHFIEFLMERAQIRIFYGDDDKAREDLLRAAKIRHFNFALTGALGKRTQFQTNDLSQLVVLARSRDHEPETYSSRKSSRAEGMDSRKGSRDEAFKSPSRSPSVSTSHQLPIHQALSSPKHEHHVSPLAAPPYKPQSIPLNDDTLLEHIKFKEQPTFEPQPLQTTDGSSLPSRLTEVDPSNQPLLHPVDSIILLDIASSIQNTSPTDGLTREETLPYAIRVLEGGSSNWQVYTQALLVRSRIEGFKSRTAERGLLQLQALVDQVIAETSTSLPPTGDSGTEDGTSQTARFLPRPKPSESASVAERLKYVYQLAPPLRWELESELAQRWTAMGGLKTALEIYERLQIYAETALCLAATGREEEASKLLQSLLYVDTTSASEHDWRLKSDAPSDTPRLLCILGDINGNPFFYEAAWSHSGHTYSRAQRSLGRYYLKAKRFEDAATAYQNALQRGKLDHATWFALGCVQLELADLHGAIESFTRCVVLEDNDAESWSNLAVSLLQLPIEEDVEDHTARERRPSMTTIEEEVLEDEDVDPATVPKADPYRHKKEALRALRRAATLKRDDARIWDNYLTVAASIPPSQGTPWTEVVQAMSRVVELRSKKEGEGCVDLKILSVLVEFVTSNIEYPDNDQPSAAADHERLDTSSSASDYNSTVGKMDVNAPTKFPFVVQALLQLIDNKITPLATSSAPLYILLSRTSRWRKRPSESLSLHEKAWRAVTAAPGVYDTEEGWSDAADATLDLVESYEELGNQERERTGGKVEPQWRFKARSAVRGVIGRGRASWSETEGYQKLNEALEGLKLAS